MEPPTCCCSFYIGKYGARALVEAYGDISVMVHTIFYHSESQIILGCTQLLHIRP